MILYQYLGSTVTEFWGKMLGEIKRKSLILKYLCKHPLSNFRQIKINHAKHEYHSKYLHRFLDELISEKKVNVFMNRYYAIPEIKKEIETLVNMIKSVDLTKPAFKKLKYDYSHIEGKLENVLNNCICLYLLKMKIHTLQGDVDPLNKQTKVKFNKKFIKMLQTYSYLHYYSNYLWSENYHKEVPSWKNMKSQNDSLKRILQFLLYFWNYSSEYYDYIKNNRVPLKEILNRLEDSQKEGITTTAQERKLTNKAISRSLKHIETNQGITHHYVDFYPGRGEIIPKETRPMFMEIALRISAHRHASTRRKYAKIWERKTGIEFTKIIH